MTQANPDNREQRSKRQAAPLDSVSQILHKPLSRLFYRPTPGKRPGLKTEELAAAPAGAATFEPVQVTCFDYGPDQCQSQAIDQLDAFLSAPRPPWATVRWINVSGLSDMKVVQTLGQRYDLHALAIEDLLHVPQRPKVKTFAAQQSHHPRLFIIAQMNRLVDGRIMSEQVSIFVAADTLLTFQERPGDVWDPVRQRLQQPGSRLRAHKTGYLTYALLDALIDHHFTILEHYGDELEHLEKLVLDRPSGAVISKIHATKRELLLLRRNVWPMREVIHALQHDESDCISDETRLFLRDAYDHAVQVLDVVETYREVAGGLADTHMTVVGNRMNDVMKTLTMVATIFIPISFLAGVFGMNFDDMPGIHAHGAFFIFCAGCAAVMVTMVVWFRRKGWL